MFEHNYDLCNRNGIRCVHCCTIDYSNGKEYYDDLFEKRRLNFDDIVKSFPNDVNLYFKKEKTVHKRAIDSCFFLGNVDGNPGCMIHPTLWDGVDIRADEELIGETCMPTKGCYFNQYFKTKPEQTILEEFTQGVDDWFSYSKALHDAAVFNKGWSYVISRMSDDEVSVSSVDELVENIHCSLREVFPNKKGPVTIGSVSILESIRKKKRNIFPTEYFMLNSKQFVNWGLNTVGYVLGKIEFDIESKFKFEDFEEWGHFFEEETFFIYKPTGEILPLNFKDVAITFEKQVEKAIKIIDKAIQLF